MDTYPICQERDLEGKTVTRALQNIFCFEARVNDNDGRRIYLQGDEVFKNLNALVVLRVLLAVGVCKEGLQRMKTG